MASLTEHLLALDPEAFKKATQTKFLEKAGKGILSKNVLEQWLAQDRLYAQAYVRFVGRVISDIQPPVSINPLSLEERLIDLFVDALTNVRRELKFFEDVAGKYGLDISVKEEGDAVVAYKELFGEVAGSPNILEKMVLLWGTEKCYLEAWRYAKTFQSQNEGKKDADGGALRKEFIPNWTSDEFVEFVERIEGLVQEVFESETGSEIEGCDELWGRILGVEEGFWPVLE